MKSLILAALLATALPTDDRQRLREAYWILTGQASLQEEWQRGYDQHIMDNIDEWAGESK